MRDVGEEEEEETISVCKEGKSCDAPPLFTARASFNWTFPRLYAALFLGKSVEKETRSLMAISVFILRVRSIS